MIARDILERWPRLTEHPALFVAVRNGARFEPEQAAREVLLALTGAQSVERTLGELLDRGDWASAEELVERAAVDPSRRDAMRAQLTEERLRWRLDADVSAAALQLRAAGVGRHDLAERFATAAATGRREAERLRATALAELEHAERDKVAELDDVLRVRTGELAWPAARVLAVQRCLSECRLEDARELLDRDDDELTRRDAWPRRRTASYMLRPELTGVAAPWPVDVPAETALGWFAGQRPPGGSVYVDAAAVRADPTTRAMLEHLERAVRGSEGLDEEAFAAALVTGLDGELVRRAPHRIRILDARLACLAFVGSELQVQRVDGRGARAGISLSDGTSTADVSFATLFSALNSGVDVRIQLLRAIFSQIDVRHAVMCGPGAPAIREHLPALLRWLADLLAVDIGYAAIDCAVELAGGRDDLALALFDVLLHQGPRGTSRGIGSLAAAWGSEAFARAATGALTTAVGRDEVALSLLAVAGWFDVETLDLGEVASVLETPVSEASVAAGSEALCGVGLAVRCDDGRGVRVERAIRRLARRLLPEPGAE